MTRHTLALCSLAVALGAIPGARAQQPRDEPRPPQVTDSAIARGKKVYNGPANCAACHGVVGRGTVDGPDLTDRTWIMGRGSYAEILDRVTHGVPRRESATGTPMPVRGWSAPSDNDVQAVAAYVWSLSRLKTPASAPPRCDGCPAAPPRPAGQASTPRPT